MLGGPSSRSRREARARERRQTSDADAAESSKVLDLYTPNKEEPILQAE
jgi:hypothetical protein